MVPGLMTAGEAACASVHGANRLGSNSLTDLVVFGRACAIRAGQIVDRDAAIPDANPVSVEKSMDRFDKLRHAKGAVTTATIRLNLQKAMQEDAAVFRTSETLKQGCNRVSKIDAHFDDVRVTDRSMIWNSDLMGDAGAFQPDPVRAGHGLFGRGPPPRAAAPTRTRTIPTATTRTGASTPWPGSTAR